MPKEIDGVTYYTVRFLNRDRSDLLGTCDVESGGDATALAPQPESYEGETFTGWSADITHVTEDMTVWPLYETQTFTVRFLNYAGTDVLSQQKVAYGEDAAAPTPERVQGHIFLCWNAPFKEVKSDLTIRPVYRTVPEKPTLNFYQRNADDTSGELIKSYGAVNACTIVQKLSGECTIRVKLLTRQTQDFVTVENLLELDGLVFHITEVKKSISGGMCYTEMAGEHVSYLLNDDRYKVESFDMTGTPRDILAILLSGTPFTVGEVDAAEPVTLRINKEVTRRACVMQLTALAGCEIEYYGFTIGLRNHLGSLLPIDIMRVATVKDISYAYNVSEGTINYSLSLYRKGALQLGDELSIDFAPMRINAASRVVGIDWNPFNFKEVSITVGDYLPTLNDSLYELMTSVEDIRQTTSRYTVEFGELIGNGTFYFTRAYLDRPYFHIHTSDGSKGTVTLNKKDGSAFSAYVGATLSGVNTDTVTLVVFYCTVPDESIETTEVT